VAICGRLIFNDWFRDENLQSSLAVPVNDGPDSQSTYDIERSRKRKDYFTGCLPWPQKGTASFGVPGGMSNF
jgi:hypothetical protein